MRVQWRPHTHQGTAILNFFLCDYKPIYFDFIPIHFALVLRSVCSLYCVVTYPISLKILRSTRVLSSFTFLTPVFALGYFLPMLSPTSISRMQ